MPPSPVDANMSDPHSPPVVADLIGIDVGGTKTSVLATHGGRTVLDDTVASSRWRGSTLYPDRTNMNSLGRFVLSLIEPTADARIAAGIHGCDSDAHIAIAREVLGATIGTQVHVVNDAALLGPAAGDEPTIQLIAGTGSIVRGQRADGTDLTADGYSWILGDDGGAAAIVRESLRCVLRRSDRGMLAGDPLLAALLDAFGAADPAELAARATEQAGASEWGRHAPLVFDVAAAGSPLAAQVIDDAAADLAAGVASVIRRGAIGGSIVAAGAVIVAQPGFQEKLRQHLHRQGVALPLRILTAAPALGALRIAASRR